MSSLAGAALIAAACSSSPSHPQSKPNMTSTSSVAPTGAVVAVDAAPVPGVGSVLVTGSGRTLYKDSQEVGGKVACIGSCATAWPPYLVPPGSMPELGPQMMGAVSMVTRPDGTHQVAYNGSPLYLFSGDRGPGTASGNGIGGIWSVVPASSGAAPGAATPGVPNPAGGVAPGSPGSSPAPAPSPGGANPAGTVAPAPATAPAPTSPPTTSPAPTTTAAPATTAPPAPTTTHWG